MARNHLTPDTYDRTSARDFISPPPDREFRITTKMKRGSKRWKTIAAIQKTQKTGRESETQWRAKYERYLASPRWATLKSQVLRDRGAVCERCGASGSVKRLDLHHLSYVRLGKEEAEDLKLYCRECHNTMHRVH